MRIQVSLLVAIVAASQLGATDCGQVLRDPGFDLWCGDQLCAWKVERGTTLRVPTWHEGDSGVELAGSDTAIEQLAPVNASDGNCIKFNLVANIEDNAEVYLNIDMEGDGTLEMHERLPTSHWEPLSYDILLAGPYDGIRFELTKTGAGQAVLANIGANTDGTGCAGLTPLSPGPRPNGASCNQPTDCMSGLCSEGATAPPGGSFLGLVCIGCDPAASACGAGTVCGLGAAVSPVLAVPTECVMTQTQELGEQCLINAECASNICTRYGNAAVGRCSACASAADCPMSQACGQSWGGGPSVCAPGGMKGGTGAGCGTDDDCLHGTCNGTIREECDDGRSCDTAESCPVTSGLIPGHCNTVGIQGGTCE